MTESCIPKDLDSSIKLLLSTSLKVHDMLYGTKQQRFWFVCTSKIYSAYTKIDDATKFIPMFKEFFEENKEFFSKPIFYDDTNGQSQVNDSLLKFNEVCKGPGINPSKSMSSSSSSWSPSDSYCKGHVIYFDNENVKTRAVCIPIGEIYQASTKLYKEQHESNMNARSAPGKILLALYSIFSHILEKKDENVERNLKMVGEFIEQILAENTGKSGESSLSGLTKIMADTMKSSGINSGNLNAGELENALSNVLNTDTIKSVSSVIGEMMSAVSNNTRENATPGEVISNIGAALQNDSIKNALGNVVTQSNDLLATIPGMENMMGSSKSGESSEPSKPTESAKLQD